MLVTIWLGCAGETDPTTTIPEGPNPYEAPGPWDAGTAELEITGSDGLPLTVQIWYPTAEGAGPTVFYDGALLGDAFPGAAPDCAEPHPLVAFSHGSGGVRWQSPFFTEFLATHGYVVVAPDHRGNTFFVATSPFEDLMLRRPQDIEDTVDWAFDAAADPESPYVGCVDPDAGYAVAGHSFGGYTALALSGATVNDPFGTGTVQLGDPRVWAAVAFAPWDGAGAITGGTSEVGVRTMILTGALDETTPLAQVDGLWDPLTVDPRYYGVFPEAGHFSFSPVACYTSVGDGCGDAFIAPDVFMPLVAQASTAFIAGEYEQIPLDAPEIEWAP